MLNSACRRHFGFDLKNRALDTTDLTLHFERAGAFSDCVEIRGFDVDTLCRLFAITPHARHTTGGDAFLTAQGVPEAPVLGTGFWARATLARLSSPSP